ASVTSHLPLHPSTSTPSRSPGTVFPCFSEPRTGAPRHPTAFSVACATPVAGSQPGCERGGGERDRTDDLLLAKQALSQLSYTPFSEGMVGQGGFEPPTSRLSSA